VNETTTPPVIVTEEWSPEKSMQLEWYLKGYFKAREEYAGY
jgi:hypothetical protein